MQTSWHAASVDLGHPAVIAAATAVGYLVAYLDRLGEAIVYEIPLDYIAVSVTDALSRVSIVFVAILLLVGVARLEVVMARRLPAWAREPLNTAANWTLFTLLALVLVWQPRLALVALVIGVFWTVVHTSWAFARRRRAQPNSQTARKSDGIPVLGGQSERRVSIRARVSTIALLLVVALFLAVVGGGSRAATRDRYLVSTENPREVLLVVYSDSRAVLGEQSDDGSLSAKRILIGLSDKKLEFEWKTIEAIGFSGVFGWSD